MRPSSNFTLRDDAGLSARAGLALPGLLLLLLRRPFPRTRASRPFYPSQLLPPRVTPGLPGSSPTSAVPFLSPTRLSLPLLPFSHPQPIRAGSPSAKRRARLTLSPPSSPFPGQSPPSAPPLTRQRLAWIPDSRRKPLPPRRGGCREGKGAEGGEWQGRGGCRRPGVAERFVQAGG